jgi:hypothetical protein
VDTPRPVVQPPWRQIALETLKANDPGRLRDLKRNQELESFLDRLTVRAEKTYLHVLQQNEGQPDTFVVNAAQKIVMEHVILGEIPPPARTLASSSRVEQEEVAEGPDDVSGSHSSERICVWTVRFVWAIGIAFACAVAVLNLVEAIYPSVVPPKSCFLSGLW